MTDLGLKSKLLAGKAQLLSLKDLNPAKYNPRKISKANFERLKKSLEDLDYFDPIIVNRDMTIISGHQRVKAMQEMGYEVAEVIQVDVPEETAKKMNLAANSRGLMGEWDSIPLADLLASMTLTADDLDVIGFSEEEVNQWKNLAGNKRKWDGTHQYHTESSGAPGAITKPGDICDIGPHRLGCLDSSAKDSYDLLLGDEMVNLVVTSPPYFNQRDYSSWENINEYMDFIHRVLVSIKDRLASDAILCWNIGWQPGFDLPSLSSATLHELGLEFKDAMLWKKKNPMSSGNLRFKNINARTRMYAPVGGVEAILIYGNGKLPKFEMDDVAYVKEMPTCIWEITRENRGWIRKLHSAPYPIEVPERLIRCYSSKGAIVLDPFSGLASTGVACLRTDRCYRGMELDPVYMDRSLARMKHHLENGNDEFQHLVTIPEGPVPEDEEDASDEQET